MCAIIISVVISARLIKSGWSERSIRKLHYECVLSINFSLYWCGMHKGQKEERVISRK